MTIAWVTAAVTTFYLQWRHRFGGEDGGDQMLSIMCATFALCLPLGDLAAACSRRVYFSWVRKQY
jgi:hypothetical protein